MSNRVPGRIALLVMMALLIWAFNLDHKRIAAVHLTKLIKESRDAHDDKDREARLTHRDGQSSEHRREQNDDSL